MKHAVWLSLAMSLWALSACIHGMNLYSRDGERLKGRYRYSQGDAALIQIVGSDGEILNGRFVRVKRSIFVESFKKTFGSDSIEVHGPDLSAYAHGFGASFARSYVITDSAQGEHFSTAAGNSLIRVNGPLFYWTGSLQGGRGTKMECYLIGSSHTRNGFGRCKNHTGKEYSVEF